MYMTGPLFRVVAMCTGHSTVPTRALYLQFVGLLFPTLLSTFNYPLTLDKLAYVIPVDMVTAWLLWLPRDGLCAELSRRASHGRDSSLSLLTR